MKQSHAVYRQMTGYSLAGSVVLAVLGFWLILFTFPNVFYQLAAAGLPFGMAPIIDAALAFVGRLIDGSRTGFIDFLRVPLAAALPLMIWLLIAATGIRAIRTRSRRPLLTVGINLGLGIVAFPLLAWILKFAFWIVNLGFRVMSWFASLSNSGGAAVSRTFGLVVIVILAVAGLVWLVASWPRARWLVAGFALVVGVAYLFRSSLGPLWAGFTSGVSAVGSAIATAIGFLGLVVLAIVVWVLALLVLAYLGSTMWTPLRDAARSGRQSDRFADVAAGIGVATSTLITAAAYNEEFAEFLRVAAETRLATPGLGVLPNILDLSFAQVMPADFHDVFVLLFKGFNGAPDLLVVGIACVIGIMSLTFYSGTYATSEGRPTILTLGFLRVAWAMFGTIIALVLTSSSD